MVYRSKLSATRDRIELILVINQYIYLKCVIKLNLEIAHLLKAIGFYLLSKVLVKT